jgi:hypothetical protein
MILGNSKLWLKHIIDIDKAFIKCVKRVWPFVIERLGQTEKEDTITERLVDLLREDREVCQYGFINLHFKLREKDTVGDYTTKGILDMALFLDQDHERYIAYECKRLNIVNDEKIRKASLAGPYIEEGVVRYVTAKYSEKLPFGCMIGYVMDGDIPFAIQQLKSAIDKRKKLINLVSNNIEVQNCDFETTHNRISDSSSILVRHRLLSMIT